MLVTALERHGLRTHQFPLLDIAPTPNLDDLRAALGDALDAYLERRGSKWHIDLKAINAHWLRSIGVQHIDICDHCTACMPELYWSHRKMGNARGVQAAMIALQSQEAAV